MLHCLGKQNLPGTNEDVTYFTPSLDFLSGDLQVPELLGQQAVPLQDTHHEHSHLEDLVFQHFQEDIVFNNGSDAKKEVTVMMTLNISVSFEKSHVCYLVISCLSLMPLPSLVHPGN